MLSARHLGLEVRGSSGGEEICLCPFHHDTTPSAWFNPRRGLFYCAVCHLGLNVGQLAKRLGIALDEVEYLASESAVEDYNLFEEQLRLDLGIELYHSYFKERNVSQVALNNYGVRWSEDKRAAVLPVTDLQGVVKGATYRYTKGKVRYYKIGETYPVWPMHLLPAFNPKRLLVVVEGAFSALRINTVDPIVQCVAILGAKASRKLVETLKPLHCVFLYDGDSAGRTACLRMRSINPLANSWTVDSPDESTDSQIQTLIEKIERVTGYGR